MGRPNFQNILKPITNWPRLSTQTQTIREQLAHQAIAEYAQQLKASSTNKRYNCETCKDTGLIDDPECAGFAMPCPQCTRKQEAERLQRICGLSERERLVSLNLIRYSDRNSDTARMVQAARDFIENPAGMLTIYGQCGNAKTVTLQSIVNASMNNQVSAIYSTFFDVVNWIRETYQRDENGAQITNDSAAKRIRQLSSVRVLCIDEMDKVKPTEWVRELQTQLIDNRYRRGLSGECGTVFAMNGNPEVLPDWIYSRMRDGRNKMICNNDRDMRPLIK